MRSPAVVARYGGTAIVLHWLLALMIICMLGVGLYMTGLPVSPARLRIYNWHKWGGITILLLSAVRLLWRLSHPAPPLQAATCGAMRRWERMLYRGTHGLLYLLFFAVPLAGWAYSSAEGYSVLWFGLVPLPDWMPVDRPLADAVLRPLHRILAWMLGFVVLLHVAAVLKHQWIDRAAILQRMWPGPRP